MQPQEVRRGAMWCTKGIREVREGLSVGSSHLISTIGRTQGIRAEICSLTSMLLNLIRFEIAVSIRRCSCIISRLIKYYYCALIVVFGWISKNTEAPGFRAHMWGAHTAGEVSGQDSVYNLGQYEDLLACSHEAFLRRIAWKRDGQFLRSRYGGKELTMILPWKQHWS